MKQFKAEHGAVSVNSGQVALSGDQARARMHCLKPVKVNLAGNGTYQVIAPIQFKRGESFGFDGDIGKNGVLSDPKAEQLAAMEADEALVKKATAKLRRECDEEVAKLKAGIAKTVEIAVAAAEKDLTQKLTAEANARVEAAGDEARDALLAALKPETAVLVRAELADPAAGG